MRYDGRRVFIGHLCPRLFVKTCIWNVSRGAVHTNWQMRTVLFTWSTLSFCFTSSRSMPLTLFSLPTKRCSRSLRLTISRTKSVADCENFLWRSLAFYLVWPLRGPPLPGRLKTACVPQLFEQLINTTLSSFLAEIRLSPSLCTPSNIIFLSKSCPRRKHLWRLLWWTSDATNSSQK